MLRDTLLCQLHELCKDRLYYYTQMPLVTLSVVSQRHIRILATQCWNVTKYIYSTVQIRGDCSLLQHLCFMQLSTSTPLHLTGKYCTFLHLAVSITHCFSDEISFFYVTPIC